jgi:hypothetical protein
MGAQKSLGATHKREKLYEFLSFISVIIRVGKEV